MLLLEFAENARICILEKNLIGKTELDHLTVVLKNIWKILKRWCFHSSSSRHRVVSRMNSPLDVGSLQIFS
jgi:hypothetical protein